MGAHKFSESAKQLAISIIAYILRKEVFDGEGIWCSTNMDPAGRKLELTTEKGIAIHLTR